MSCQSGSVGYRLAEQQGRIATHNEWIAWLQALAPGIQEETLRAACRARAVAVLADVATRQHILTEDLCHDLTGVEIDA